MQKRLLSLLLALVTLLTFVVPVIQPVSAAYENTYVNTGDQRADIIGVALTQVGYEEGPDNDTKYGDWMGLPNYPWCGIFVTWCARQANIPTSVLASTGLAKPSAFGYSTYYTSDEYTPRQGDLFFKKDFSHVGLVYYVDGDYFYTVEGNTSTTSYEGVAVMSRRRALSEYYFVSPNYTSDTSHNYEKHYEDAHPHKVYYACTDCSSSYYTGDTVTVDTCQECIQANCSHSYGSWGRASDSQHQRTCSKCGKTETEDHDWKNTATLVEASCGGSGSRRQTCSDCGAERIVTISATGNHSYGTWEYVNDEAHKRTCSNCGGTDVQKHAINEETQWQSDEKQHWQECEDCGEKVASAEHVFGEDCTSPCEVCGYIREDGHAYAEEWSSDEVSHWRACETCGEQGDLEEHVYSAECDEDCDICGYVRQVTHTYSTELTADETGHWYECEVCGKREQEAAHTAGPEATEDAAQCCTLCGYEIAPKLEHVHVFEYYDEGATHWGECACGEVLAREAHLWDMSTGECSVCHAKSSGQLEQADWDFVWLIIGGVLVAAAIIVPVTIVVCKRKKKKALEGDPYQK